MHTIDIIKEGKNGKEEQREGRRQGGSLGKNICTAYNQQKISSQNVSSHLINENSQLNKNEQRIKKVNSQKKENI